MANVGSGYKDIKKQRKFYSLSVNTTNSMITEYLACILREQQAQSFS
jgi:hypothetical protein